MNAFLKIDPLNDPRHRVQHLLNLDQQHVWHPYAKTPNPQPALFVKTTQGSLMTITNEDGASTDLVDGMSSWWSAIHGYNHPVIMQAMHAQIDTMPHIMFGGLTHEPAITLCKTLVDLTPKGLNHVFLSDSGSVAMEVAIKMALQYWQSHSVNTKTKLLTVKNGYHGDTFATMSICDPDNGMHHLFTDTLAKNLFVDAPLQSDEIHATITHASDLTALETTLKSHHESIAAFVIEPIVQGAGGMRFYRAEYLKQAQLLCKKYNVLFIADEIATGFGRTGKLFACEWAGISPDIMAIGKSMTGGNISLAATLCQDFISQTISNTTQPNNPGLLMHGPTFMGNPLACATANASIKLLQSSPWQDNIKRIETHLKTNLYDLKKLAGVDSVRVLGAIGVVELAHNGLAEAIQTHAINNEIWVRPFGRLAYIMPAFNIPDDQLAQLTSGLTTAITQAIQNKP